jgi:hypothetical protein
VVCKAMLRCLSITRLEMRYLSAYHGLDSAVWPLLAARALPLRCAASTSTNFYTASYLTRILAAVVCGSGSTCVSVLSS